MQAFALILAPFLRKNDCVSLMVGEPRRLFLQIGLFMAAASRYNMKTTWRKDTVSFLATDHAGNTPGAQIKRHHPLSLLLPLGDYSGRGDTVWLCLYSNSISRCDGGPQVGWKFLIRPACNRCDAGGCPRAVGPVLFD